ncbi:MAG: extracellular solute-binding protein, partial [Anaerolineae bacterium]
AVLDLEHDAVMNGDGELFLSLQADDPAWISAQLRPENQVVTRAGLQVTHAEQYEEFIWANVIWTTDGETRQRIAFFKNQDGRLLHIPTAPPNYWGPQWQNTYRWGALVYYGVDQEWREDISAFVTEIIARICATNCLEDRFPLTLILAKDYGQTAATGHLRLPSPRLLALDENGRPAPLFWQMLQQQIERYLTPATVRFAVLPLLYRGDRYLTDYEQAAAAFMATHPDITIELVNLEEIPDNLANLAADYDGAAIPPTQAMLAAGLVRDLTDYVNTDPAFDRADFYEQIWQGVQWQERIWWIPQAASMRLLFYDKVAYRLANRPEPSLHWTWTEMTQDITTLISAQPEGRDLSWGFMDTGLDTIFSYAYNWDNHCTEEATVLCPNRLQTQNVAAALDWYSQMASQPETMPDFTGLVSFDRDNMLWNWQGARRQAAIWANLPVFYEHHLLLSPIGIVPFPGSENFDGITPLWVQGSFVSQQSERPLAVWQWLKFLSYQRPVPRLIPARPSVAAEMGYWTNLPPSLNEAMRIAFPFALPVTLEEQSFLSWAQVAAVVSGELSPYEAAGQRSDIAWFGQD